MIMVYYVNDVRYHAYCGILISFEMCSGKHAQKAAAGGPRAVAVAQWWHLL
jgi:hypothetical protein